MGLASARRLQGRGQKEKKTSAEKGVIKADLV